MQNCPFFFEFVRRFDRISMSTQIYLSCRGSMRGGRDDLGF